MAVSARDEGCARGAAVTSRIVPRQPTAGRMNTAAAPCSACRWFIGVRSTGAEARRKNSAGYRLDCLRRTRVLNFICQRRRCRWRHRHRRLERRNSFVWRNKHRAAGVRRIFHRPGGTGRRCHRLDRYRRHGAGLECPRWVAWPPRMNLPAAAWRGEITSTMPWRGTFS